MAELSLIMPMAGRGSRFSTAGEPTPKPLVEIAGRPFFWWATESVLRAARVREIVFVVLEEHIAHHGIDRAIGRYYPDARIVVIAEPTSGAAETGAIGVAALTGDGPIAINDCDHAFRAPGLGDLVDALSSGAAGGLVGFASDDPAYSFVRLDAQDPTRVLETVEKQRVGPFAIAGCYLFRDRPTFAAALKRYRETCSYAELFVSGLYNVLCGEGELVRFQPLERHISFGAPSELARVSPEELQGLFAEPSA